MSEQAILFDTRSIQRYIFSGNTLKTNIGASYLVDHIFEDILLGTILSPQHRKKYQIDSVDFLSWKEAKEPVKELPADCYTAYIGGGNALLLFKKKNTDYRKQIITDFTMQLLVKCPGLKTGAAMGDIDLSSPERFNTTLNRMYVLLKQNQNTVFPQVNIPYTGLTLTCDVNGETANFYDAQGMIDASPRFFSQEVWAKTQAAAYANRELAHTFKEQLGNIYQLPAELNCLGQRESENDIAIVHIDGNQMGVRFNKCQDLTERSQLSREIKEQTTTSFAKLLETIIAEYNTYADFLDLKNNFLPIRPLILGGDDITFVCPARMAVTYAKRFMNFMNQDLGILTVGENHCISSCAGVAILPAAYPFFRGYQLAEQLCDAAKAKSRTHSTTCWLDFAILHGEQAPELAQIRQNEYTGVQGNMHFGPYRVDDTADIHSLDALLRCAESFRDELPRNKVKRMRFVLQRGKADIHTFMEQWHHQKLQMPDIPQWEMYKESLWYSAGGASVRTPYVDAIEMMEYIPEISNKGGNVHGNVSC